MMHPPHMVGFDGGYVAALIVLMVVLTAAVYTELQSNRIPNGLTLGGMGVGLLIGWSPWGISLGSSLIGLAIGFGFLFMFYVFGGMGGGDVKLMGAVGALLGHQLIQPTLVYTAFIGGAMAVVTWIWHAKLWDRAAATATGEEGGTPPAEGADPAEEVAVEAPATPIDPVMVPGRTIPYGLAIVAGSLLTVFLNRA